jgi:hypothetical protein
MPIAISIYRLKDHRREIPYMHRPSALSRRRVEIRKRLDTDDPRCGAWHTDRLGAQAMAEIAVRKCIISVIGRWVQKRGCIRALVVPTASVRYEIGSADDLGRPYLDGLALQPFPGSDNSEYAVSLVLPGARPDA